MSESKWNTLPIEGASPLSLVTLVAFAIVITACMNVTESSAPSVLENPYSASLSASPKVLYMLPNKTEQIYGQGGSGRYTFSIGEGSSCQTSNGQTLGSMAASTGLFTSGSNPGTCAVIVKDNQTSVQAAGLIVILEALTLSPREGFVNAGAQLQMVAAGGLPPYTYTLIGTTGGWIDPLSGLLTAPPENLIGGINAVTLVEVKDAAGNKTQSQVTFYKSFNMTPNSGLFPSTTPVVLTQAGGVGDIHYSIVSGQGIAGISSITTNSITVTPNPGFQGQFVIKISDSLTPISNTTTVRLSFFNPRSVAVGKRHACSVNSDNALYCWGANDRGQIGDTVNGPLVGDDPLEMGTELRSLTSFKNVYDIAVAGHMTCILYGGVANTSRMIRCWGAKDDYYTYGSGFAYDMYSNPTLRWSEQNLAWGANSYGNLFLSSTGDHQSITGANVLSFMQSSWSALAGFWTQTFNSGDMLLSPPSSVGTDWVLANSPSTSNLLTSIMGTSYAGTRTNASDTTYVPSNFKGSQLCWQTSLGTINCGNVSGSVFGLDPCAIGGGRDAGYCPGVAFQTTITTSSAADGSTNGAFSKLGEIKNPGKLVCYVFRVTATGSSYYSGQKRIVCMQNGYGAAGANSNNYTARAAANVSVANNGNSIAVANSYFTGWTANGGGTGGFAHPEFANVFQAANTPSAAIDNQHGERPALDVVYSASAPSSPSGKTVCGLFDDTANGNGNIVICWGSNSSGALGIGSNDQQVSLASPPFTTGTGPVYISTLADGNTAAHHLPVNTRANVQFPSGHNPVALHTTGAGAFCAQTYWPAAGGGDGKYHLFCWGANTLGQLGNYPPLSTSSLVSTEAYRSSPVEVLGVSSSSPMEVKSASQRFCARLSEGGTASLMCWGDNSFAVLGQGQDANASPYLAPGPVDLAMNVDKFAVGESHACAVDTTTNGPAGSIIKCWGGRYFGALGAYTAPLQADENTEIGPPSNTEAPGLHNVPIGTHTAKEVFAGYSHTCVVLSGDNDGQVLCFGANSDGELGRNDVFPRADVGAHHEEAIARTLTLDRSFLDSSSNNAIQAGWLTSNPVRRPKVIKLSGRFATFALTDSGDLFSWGNSIGSTYFTARAFVSWSNLLGHGVTAWANNPRPNRVLISNLPGGTVAFPDGTSRNLPGGVVDIAASQSFACAVIVSGDVHCWGDNSKRQMGRVSGTGYPAGQPVTGTGSNGDLSRVSLGNFKAVAVTAGTLHACAMSNDGRVKCWGDNNMGQLGLNFTTSWGNPVPNLADSGALTEMGDNLLAINLGTDSQGNARTAVQIVAGDYHTCALLKDGNAVCWGDNAFGQLGIGTTNSVAIANGQMGAQLQLVTLPFGNKILKLAAGGSSTCAVLSNNSVVCWGDNTVAQLGTGNRSPIGIDLTTIGSGFVPVKFPNN
jgi:alpha-tubulin suppressor-like RCC1 family protein